MLLSVRSADRHFVSGELQGAADMDRDLASRIALGPGGSPDDLPSSPFEYETQYALLLLWHEDPCIFLTNSIIFASS